MKNDIEIYKEIKKSVDAAKTSDKLTCQQLYDYVQGCCVERNVDIDSYINLMGI